MIGIIFFQDAGEIALCNFNGNFMKLGDDLYITCVNVRFIYQTCRVWYDRRRVMFE